MELQNYKHRLSDYLNYKNIEQKKGFYRCPNPAHDDHEPSAKLYTNESGQHITCMSVCGCTWDIFDVAGLLINSDDFKEQLSEVERTLGIYSVDTTSGESVYTAPFTGKPDKPKQSASANDIHLGKDTAIKHVDPPVSIPIEKLNEVYNDEKILAYAKEKEYGDTIAGKYICFSGDGETVLGIEYRFESENKSKTVFLIWYNGKTIKWTNPPRLIFGLNEIKPDRPYLIVEGPKTREIASQHLPEFNVLTWNGGANNVDKVDWSDVIPGDATVYLWADDDQPGVQAMMKIEEVLR